MKAMEIGAVIVTYNSADTLSRCILGLWAEGVSTIVVVDNASADNSVAIARGLGVICLAQSDNKGFAQACNYGAKQLHTPVLLFINPDAVLLAKALSRAAQHLINSRQVGVVGLTLVSSDLTPEAVDQRYPVTLRHLLFRQLLPAPPTTRSEQVSWVSGGAMLVRRQAWQAAAGFDENFFLYWEDVDFCQRLRTAGWQIILEPRALVQHQRGASPLSSPRRTQLYDASADRYFKKHYTAPVWATQRLLRRLYRVWSPQVR